MSNSWKRLQEAEARDRAQNKAAARQRNRERNWTESICEPGRVYNALPAKLATRIDGAADCDVGYDHRAFRSTTNPLVYNHRTGFWEHAVTQDQVTQQVTQQYKLVKADTLRRVAAPLERHARNFHKSGNS